MANTLKWDYVASKIQLCKTITTQADTSRGHTFESMTVLDGIIPPEILNVLALHPIDASHGADFIYMNNGGGLERLPLRGGSWYSTSAAGVFALYLSLPRSFVSTHFGFRSAFVL
jgi:hypothetical protein